MKTTTHTLKRPPAQTPRRYQTEGNKSAYDTLVSAHYFLPGTCCDWYVLEYEPEDDEIFCWAEIVPGCGEFGNSSLREMEELVINVPLIIGEKRTQVPCRVELDEHWTVRPLDAVLAERAKS